MIGKQDRMLQKAAMSNRLLSRALQGSKYEILIKDIDELIEVEDDSVLNTYIPEPKEIGPIRLSSAYGWNYQLWVSNRLIWSGSFSVSVFEDAFSASKHGRVEMILWPIESGGLPIGTNE